MSKDTSALDSERSLESWNKSVIKRRGEYSLRVKSALLTRGSGYSSWPTMHMGSNERGAYYDKTGKGQRYLSDAVVDEQKNWPTVCASEVRQGFQDRSRGMKGSQESLTTVVIKDAANWPTPAVMDTTGGSYKTEWVDGRAVSYHNHKQENPVAYGAKLSDAVKHSLPAPANPSTDGSRQESSGQSLPNWQTFAHGTHNRGETPHRQVVKALVNGGKAKTQCLTVDQVFAEEIKGTNPNSWATLRVQMADRLQEITEDNRDHLANRNKSNLEEEIAGNCGKATGKLNPRWVETLMGLPIGWTMPSCKSPVTIAPMNCDCLGTESSQPPQNEHLELF